MRLAIPDRMPLGAVLTGVAASLFYTDRRDSYVDHRLYDDMLE